MACREPVFFDEQSTIERTQDRLSSAGLLLAVVRVCDRLGVPVADALGDDRTHAKVRRAVWFSIYMGEFAKRLKRAAIAELWGCTVESVGSALKTYAAEHNVDLPGRIAQGHPRPHLLKSLGDEVTPRFVEGEGDRREDCATYEDCLISYKAPGDARCPRRCSGYVQLRLRATDYLRQQDGVALPNMNITG